MTGQTRLLTAAKSALAAYRRVFGSGCWNGCDRAAFAELHAAINETEGAAPAAPAKAPFQVWLVVRQYYKEGERFTDARAAEIYAESLARRLPAEKIEIFVCVETRYVDQPVKVEPGALP